MKNILVSRCLLGDNCKYNGGNNYNEVIINLKNKYNIIPVCPECLGGLVSPRVPSEILGDKVYSKNGENLTGEFEVGAQKTLEIALKYNCKIAVLKANSPSCGSGVVYDGTFTGNKIKGYGIAAKLLKENGIEVVDEKYAIKL